MRLHTTSGLCTAFIITFLWILNAYGQTDIAVSDANATLTVGFGTDTSQLEASLQSVPLHRVFADFSNATIKQMLVDAPVAMRTAMSIVTPRVSPDYASASRAAPLVFPRALVNDQVAPQLEGAVVKQTGSTATSLLLLWTANEYVQSTFEYGTASGSYSQSIELDEGQYGTNFRHEVTGLTIGTTYFGRITMADLSGNQGQSEEFTFALQNPGAKPLVLVYAVLDNNLGDDAEALDRLVKNVFAGKHDDVDVRLLIDSPGPNSSYIYEVQSGTGNCSIRTDPTCNRRYQLGTTYWQANEDTAHPTSLFDFANDAINAHPNPSQILLSLVGHGAGWAAGALPGQPSAWDDQPSAWDDQPSGDGSNSETIGGLLWDDTIGGNISGSRSLSTKALRQALEWVKEESGHTIDLLYLDACSMGMAEVGYEIRDDARYLLASPNTAWASFAYAPMIQATKPNMTADAIGRAWIDAETRALDSSQYSYPYTFALYDLGQMGNLAGAVQDLGSALQAALSGQKTVIRRAYENTERYESNYEGAINQSDSYLDLGSLVVQLESHVGADKLNNSLQPVKTAINQMVAHPFNSRSGQPHTYPDNSWQWTEALGISIYFPHEDDPKRSIYTEENLEWVSATGWDEFLNAYLGDVQSASMQELPTCQSTRSCNELPKQLDVVQEVSGELYLPFVLQ
ncbi:MAG: clostripain-related cysteine peptidase [Chloroflexota bacterium]